MNVIRIVSDYRAALLTAGLLGIAIGVAQIVDRVEGAALREPAAFTVMPEGDDVARLAPITVTFPKDPAERAPENLLRVEPAAPGTYAWLSPRTLLFQPDFPGLLRGSTYTVRVPARPEAGLPFEITKKFTVTGQLTVQQVIPANGDAEVPLSAPVLVQFSRSVAPLTTLAAQPTETIVAFDPPLHGKGEWLNTSIYRFVPTDLRPATTYRVRIAKGLTSAADGVLRDDFVSTFSTIQPAVDSIAPDENWIYCGPWQQVDVTFNQPMDPSAAAGFAVRDVARGAPIPGTVGWNDAHTVLSFNPTQRLAPATKYLVTLERGLKGATAGVTANPRTASFTTIAQPSVARTYPAGGDTNAGRFGVNIQFATPMDPTSLEGKLAISGFTAEELEGRVYTYEGGVSASVSLRPSTAYTVMLAPGATDRYGQALGGYRYSFTTGALPSTVTLALPASSVAATLSASAEPMVFFQATNLPSVGFSLYRLGADEGRRLLHDPSSASNRNFTPSQPPIRTWTEQLQGTRDDVVLGSTSLSGGGPLPKGYYFLHTNGAFRSQFAFAVVDTVIVAKLSFDELLAWAVDHDTGRPVPGVTVRATGPGVSPEDRRTDANGLATFTVPTPMLGKSAGSERAYLLWIDDVRSGVLSTRWQQGVSPYQFGIPGEYYMREWVGHLYSDRPVYRPGETVELKGIIRADDDAQYSLPSQTPPFQLLITNARGQSVSTQRVTLNEFGSFGASFQIPGDAPLGNYTMSIQYVLANPFYVTSNSFLVAEFRTPEFGVTLESDRASYGSGDTISATATATFFFGGALSGVPAQWSVIAEPYAMRVKGFERYSFADVDQSRVAVYKDPLRGKGTMKTDADGAATFSVPATLQGSEGAQRFTLSASVTDENGQGAAANTTVTVHPASYYVGARPAVYVANEGRDAAIDLVTVDTDGAVAPGRAVAVRVYDRQWITTKVQIPGGGRRYESQPKDTLVQTLSAKTGSDGKARVAVRPTRPGTLRIVAEIADEQGRVQRSSTYLWVGGREFATWQVTNDDTIKLIADRESYQVGDTAEVLVPAPFAGATALITIERGKVITREVRVLPTNSERLLIPIVERSVPDVFVSVVLYRGPTPTDPLPRFKVGYVQLSVSTQTRMLNVSIEADRASAKPGDKVRYGIRVTDHDGRGVKAEVSVAVVDKAVLSLQEERGPDGLKAFWFERGLGVSTMSSMLVSLDRWNDVVVEAARVGKGGSGAGGGLASDRERKDFRNTAYWTAQLATQDDGTATVEVTLPDNLTTWRMQVRAMSGAAMVGEGLHELVSTEPLAIRSALPRFLRVGDSADLRVLVRNGTGIATPVQVALKAEGVSVNGDLVRTATIAPNTSVILSWPAKVRSEGRAKLTFTAAGGGLSDTLVQEIPVYVDLTPETMATGGIVTSQGALEAVYLPPFADTSHGTLNVQVRSALVGTMADELRYLEPTPWENAEHVGSRLMALVGVARAQRTTGATSTDAPVIRDIAGLVGRQRPDGGWAWCDQPECASDPNVTGWTLLALGEARRDGFAVDAGVVARATTYVMAHLGRATDVAHPPDPSQKAFLLAALSSAGSGSALTPSRALFEQQRANLASWGRAYLLLAFADAGVKPDDAQVRALIDDLAGATIPSANGNHWEDGASVGRGSFVTNTGATALGVLALARLQPDHMLLPQTVRWLVLARTADGWHTSIDRALGILALTTYAVGTGELGGDYSYRVLIDDNEVLAGLVKKAATPTAAQKQLPLATFTPGKTSLLAVTRDYARPGRLYYTLDLRYATPAKEIDALNRGFAVSHEYSSLEDPAKKISSVRVGETVRVKVTVMVPADRSYVVVEDLLPAGLEAVDARLKNVDAALKAKLDAERVAAFQKQAGGYMAPWYRWYYSPWQQVDLRDDRAVLHAQRLAKGVYEYVYYARATTPGDFFVAPAHAEETYFPEVFGRSDSSRFRVVP
ncbi:MAG TPA: Ig-like domain-containing protein [Candidatus Limnocylindria bacterium]|nr:Ig-like domain-containing protein [Candidatus Limnocylindria bacterium]